jgi:hypothetical protein
MAQVPPEEAENVFGEQNAFGDLCMHSRQGLPKQSRSPSDPQICAPQICAPQSLSSNLIPMCSTILSAGGHILGVEAEAGADNCSAAQMMGSIRARTGD